MRQTKEVKKTSPARKIKQTSRSAAVSQKSFVAQTGQVIAVAAAIANQLNNDNRWPPNDISKVMGDDYRYDANTIRLFLAAVRWHLAYGKPKYHFEFDNKFAAAALKQTVGELTGSVNANTSATPPANWIDP